MPKPVRIPVKSAPAVLNAISARMTDLPSPKIGEFIADVVKNPKRLEAFRANPERVLRAGGIGAKSVDTKLLVKVVDAIASKVVKLPDIVADTVSQKETSSSQDRNFDNSASWFYNKDGYNVMYDQGHSSEKTKGSTVGQDKSFSGLAATRPDLVVINEMLGKLFFPSQPLVTPALIEHIKQSAKPE
jgi:hypothetical protein